MITFKARLYDATLESYIDSSPSNYTISTCTNSEKLQQLNMVTNSHTITTIFDLVDFDFDAGTNVATRIVNDALDIHEATGEWHELRLLTTNSINDYVLIWSHVAPSNLTVIQNGIRSEIEYAIAWDTAYQEATSSAEHHHASVRMFTSASTIEQLNSEFLVWIGSFCPNSLTGNVDTYLSYTESSVSVSNPKYYCYDANTFFGKITDRSFYKTANGSCLVFWRDYIGGSNFKGPVTIRPYINQVSQVTGENLRGSAYPGWDSRFTYNNTYPTNSNSFYFSNGLWWVTLAEYADYAASYNSNGWPVFRLENSRENWQAMIDTVVSESGIIVTQRSKELYYYLLGTFEPSGEIPDSDVDPEDIPPEDTEPTPPNPDNPDPYYDPTSDPTNPSYDPTKDPTSPSYDPTTPATPYRPPTTTGGGDPGVQPVQTPITPPSTPPSYVTTNEMFTLYNPSGGDLTALAQFLWSPTWSIDTFKKIFANPLDCILGLMVMPHLPASTSSKVMNVGNISTNVTMRFFTSQFYDFDCGTIDIMEYYASYLDYSPYTKISIYLPYIGDQDLSTDEVMGKTIGVKYRFDLASGECIAFITVDGSTLYSFSGNCAAHMPLSANDWGSTIAATGAMPFAAIKIGGAIGAGPIGTLGAAAAISVMSMKERISHTGSISGSAGLMGIQTPYVIINRPRQALPLNQNSYTGYPSFITESLGSLTGYTEVEECHLEHIPATDAELEEIERLLKGGVLF